MGAYFVDLPEGGLKNRYEKNSDLWERSIASSQLLHGSIAVFRTDGQVYVSELLQQFGQNFLMDTHVLDKLIRAVTEC